MSRLTGPLVIIVAVALPAVLPADKPQDRAYIDAVLDGLVQEGVLTASKAQQIKDNAQTAADTVQPAAKPKWYETTKVSGYGQARAIWHPDPPAGEVSTDFLIRRARIKVNASPSKRSRVQLQVALDEGNIQVRDAWLEYDLQSGGEWRARLGQQKIPFGFENPQSSSRRGPLERAEITRRGPGAGRDVGVVLMWTPERDQELFAHAKKHELGTGDYGTVSVGIYNGQGTVAEENEGKHVSVRVAKPFMLGDRYAEAGASYFGGNFHSNAAGMSLDDELWGGYFYLPPRPVGIQGGYYDGETEGGDVDGFYAMGLWRPCEKGLAFVRYDEYDGPRRGRGLGNVYDRDRWTAGYAHHVSSNTELTLEFEHSETAAAGDSDTVGLQVQTTY